MREVLEEAYLPAQVLGASTKILIEETTTGFIQLAYVGVSMDLAPSGRENFEGKAHRLKFDDLMHYLTDHPRWVPSGKMSVLAWLGLGAPGHPQAMISGRRPADLFREIIAAKWPPHRLPMLQVT